MTTAAARPELVANNTRLFPSAAEADLAEHLETALNEADTALGRCFAAHGGGSAPPLQDGGAPGVTIALTIADHAGTGRTSDVQIVTSDFDNPFVSQCLATTASNLLFPPPVGRPEMVVTLTVNPPAPLPPPAAPSPP